MVEKSKSAERVTEVGRRIQNEVDAQDREQPSDKKPAKPMQAGQRDYPAKFKPQRLKKPGLEAELAEAPMFAAPGYKGSDKLKGMVALISGGDSGIGRAVSVPLDLRHDVKGSCGACAHPQACDSPSLDGGVDLPIAKRAHPGNGS